MTIATLLGMYIILDPNDQKKYCNILKAVFPEQFKDLEWEE